ncbi:sulfurtransferase [Clostridioides mangenotii]|uniref:sulfurtransferase n=1 Tax=Metaclostridioides mangenotii TaxID=1540 RepID=UPI002149AA45|nr:sulfurtransferase [Clostridioides mangenotii]MCR1954750.1 sulfurtransferase [Clostridioides mangenotii]
MKNIISAKNLIDILDKDNNLVVIDCRFDLINRTYGIDAYKKGHIPGSFILDLDKDLSKPVQKHGGKNPLQDPYILKEKLEKLGIDNNTTVVTYDDGDLNGASRLFFQLKHLGLEKVYVLDGGVTAYIKSGGILETKINEPKDTEKTLQINVDDNFIVTMDYVKSKLYSDDTVIIDCRSNDRYQGITEPAYEKAGHIPSAKNYFCKNLLNDNFENGSLKDINFLKKHFQELNKYNEIILSCGSGISACVDSLALRELDIPHKIYIGSFSDWISYEGNTIMVGEE